MSGRPAAQHLAAAATNAMDSGRRSLNLQLITLFHGPKTAWLVLICGLVVTLAAWHTSTKALRQAAEERIQLRSEEIASAIESRMIVYEQVLWGGIGLFKAGGDVSRKAFKAYIDALNLDTHWPGVQGIGFAVALKPDQLDSYINEIRAEGFPDYSVKPAGQRDFYTAIKYLEPFDWRNQRAFGYDMWSNSMRREAMRLAMETGRAHSSGIVTLVQETDEDIQRGFLTYVPLYRPDSTPATAEERQNALVGWVYAPFRMNNLMAGILGGASGEISFEIYDGEPSTDTLLYKTHSNRTQESPANLLSETRKVHLLGREWTILFKSSIEQVMGAEQNQPTLIALAGLIVDLLLFYIVTSLMTLHQRADAIAKYRTAELQKTQDQLESKIEETEQLVEKLTLTNDELGQFAYVASHDLKEPLRQISNFTSLLEEEYADKLDENANLYVKTARESAQRMQEMVHDLLEYARLNEDNQPNTQVNLNDQVNLAIENLADTITELGAKIDLINTLPTVFGKAARLRSLFQNLIGNALKYHQKGRIPEVKISTRDLGDSWQIAVQDNGIGIDVRYHERIFQPFKRLHNEGTYTGSGVGLAICRKIVSSMGGILTVASEPGEGSCFYITLPKFKAPQPLTGNSPETT